MAIVWPENTKRVIDEIRTAIGRPVIFRSTHKLDCPACTIDPVTNLSTNPFCLTCSGNGWLTIISGTTISGHITWGPSQGMLWATGGQWESFECRVQIEYTPENESIVDGSDSVVVDNKTMKINKRMPRGVKEINRILIDLKEE